MNSLQKLQSHFNAKIDAHSFVRYPENLYEPIDYIMGIGGKRLRPVAVFMACDAFGGDIKEAEAAALAIEIFHNFTLVHDDIMDEAPLRRGQQTVHEKYNLSTAILSGDMMLIDSYEKLMHYAEHPHFSLLLSTFNTAARQVCEGQQLDMDFEQRDQVSIEEYLKMIQWKTAVLFAAALKIGALLGGATPLQAQGLYEYGLGVGLAFQVQDDILDSFGDPVKFGKKVGGDIIQGKKTILVLKTLENLNTADKERFLNTLNNYQLEEIDKVESIKSYFKAGGALEFAEGLKEDYRMKGIESLQKKTDLPEFQQTPFIELAEYLLGRKE